MKLIVRECLQQLEIAQADRRREASEETNESNGSQFLSKLQASRCAARPQSAESTGLVRCLLLNISDERVHVGRSRRHTTSTTAKLTAIRIRYEGPPAPAERSKTGVSPAAIVVFRTDMTRLFAT